MKKIKWTCPNCGDYWPGDPSEYDGCETCGSGINFSASEVK